MHHIVLVVGGQGLQVWCIASVRHAMLGAQVMM
jgi:hypothetical protein